MMKEVGDTTRQVADLTATDSGETTPTADETLAALVSSSDDAIIGKTPDGIVTSWNAAAERIFGYRAYEMTGQPISILAMPGQEAEMPAIMARLKAGERIESYETERRRKDGVGVPISLTISPILDKAGVMIGASKIARDITAARKSLADQKLADEKLLQQHHELLHAARLAELGLMSTILAHEIAQPLSAISLHLGAIRRLLANDDPAVRPHIHEGVSKAFGQAERAAAIVQRLRSYARPDDGRQSSQSIRQILEDATAFATLDAGQRGVKVELISRLKPDLVWADRIEIQQVLLNLIRNGMESMEGLERRRLRLSARAASGMVEVAVADTGVGLAQEVRSRLFEPFVTTKEKGVGIGLSICRRIIEKHNGQLWADDNADGGTTFRFTLKAA